MKSKIVRNGGKGIKKPKQKKQMGVKTPIQLKTQGGMKPMQKSSYPSKSTKTVSYKKQVPFNSAHMDARIKAATGSKGKSNGKAKVEKSLWPNNTTK